MNFSRNDVVLLPIPFTDLTSRKVRPAVVIGQSGPDLFLVPMIAGFNTGEHLWGKFLKDYVPTDW